MDKKGGYDDDERSPSKQSPVSNRRVSAFTADDKDLGSPQNNPSRSEKDSKEEPAEAPKTKRKRRITWMDSSSDSPANKTDRDESNNTEATTTSTEAAAK